MLRGGKKKVFGMLIYSYLSPFFFIFFILHVCMYVVVEFGVNRGVGVGWD